MVQSRPPTPCQPIPQRHLRRPRRSRPAAPSWRGWRRGLLGHRARRAVRDEHAGRLQAPPGAGAGRPRRARPGGAVAALPARRGASQGGGRLGRTLSPRLGRAPQSTRRLPGQQPQAGPRAAPRRAQRRESQLARREAPRRRARERAARPAKEEDTCAPRQAPLTAARSRSRTPSDTRSRSPGSSTCDATSVEAMTKPNTCGAVGLLDERYRCRLRYRPARRGKWRFVGAGEGDIPRSMANNLEIDRPGGSSTRRSSSRSRRRLAASRSASTRSRARRGSP